MSIRLYLRKSTSDAQQRKEDKRGIRDLLDAEKVLEEGTEHEEAEMRAEKSRSRAEWKDVKQRKEDEYGSDEYYADPTHDSYPLTKDGKPSRERTMAAWRYINEERDEDMYTPEQREKVKSRIRAFAKKHFDEELQKSGVRAYAKAKKAHRYAYKTDERDPIFIPVNRIQTPYQTEAATNPNKVKENVAKIKRGEAMPPVIIGYDYDLHDGHHRLEAAKQSGHTHVPCVVGGTNEQRVKAAETRYRKVWKSKRKPLEDEPSLVNGNKVPLDDSWKKYRKDAKVKAKKMDSRFRVRTLEGVVTGKPGDYLCEGAKGERWPIDAKIFEETYKRA